MSKMISLGELIHKIRNCKTAAEERALVAMESAEIRTCIRNGKSKYRHIIVCKLIFLQVLGFPTHFGQLECIKLVASDSFQEKRIGYIGLMLLVGDQSELLMLVTNSIKNDLASTNRLVTSFALSAIGNLATADMARDLAPEINKHITGMSPYLRKKAFLAMARCISKVPEMVEHLADNILLMLNDDNYGVLHSLLQLMSSALLTTSYCDEEYDFDINNIFIPTVPTLVTLLRNLLVHKPQYGDPNDFAVVPLLQVQILSVLRCLVGAEKEISKDLQDVLVLVLATADTPQKGRDAVLYECAHIIMAVPSGKELKNSAINLLGTFLLNDDNNIRYVGFEMLSKYLSETDPSSIQQHRDIIVDCLKDVDNSIRRRALDLAFWLVDHTCVDSLTLELLRYLMVCPKESRGEVCDKLHIIVCQYSPNDCWRLDAFISILSIAGRECGEDIQHSIIGYISRTSEDLRCYAVHKLVKELKDDDCSNFGLFNVVGWCVGEYSDLLLKSYSYKPPSSMANMAEIFTSWSVGELPDQVTFMGLEPCAIIKILEKLINRPSCPDSILQRAITSFAKMYHRFRDSADGCTKKRLRELIRRYQTSQSLELQARSFELNSIICFDPSESFSDASSAALREALDRMPVIRAHSEVSLLNQEEKSEPCLIDLSFDDIMEISTSTWPLANGFPQSTKAIDGIDALLLLSSPNDKTIGNPFGSIVNNTAQNHVSLLPDPRSEALLLELPPPEAYNFMDSNEESEMSTKQSSEFGKGVNPPQHQQFIVKGFSQNGLNIYFECSKPCPISDPQRADLLARFENINDQPIDYVTLQVSVPSFVTMQVFPPSSTFLPARSTLDANMVTQKITVVNTKLGTKDLKLKLKVTFSLNSDGDPKEYFEIVSSFPKGF